MEILLDSFYYSMGALVILEEFGLFFLGTFIFFMIITTSIFLISNSTKNNFIKEHKLAIIYILLGILILFSIIIIIIGLEEKNPIFRFTGFLVFVLSYIPYNKIRKTKEKIKNDNTLDTTENINKISENESSSVSSKILSGVGSIIQEIDKKENDEKVIKFRKNYDLFIGFFSIFILYVLTIVFYWLAFARHSNNFMQFISLTYKLILITTIPIIIAIWGILKNKKNLLVLVSILYAIPCFGLYYFRSLLGNFIDLFMIFLGIQALWSLILFLKMSKK